MNPIFRQAGDMASGGLLMGAVTVGFFCFFALVFLRMFRPGAAAIYREAALLPLDDAIVPAPAEDARG